MVVVGAPKSGAAERGHHLVRPTNRNSIPLCASALVNGRFGILVFPLYFPIVVPFFIYLDSVLCWLPDACMC